jgi:hypothetical protein
MSFVVCHILLTKIKSEVYSFNFLQLCSDKSENGWNLIKISGQFWPILN